MKKILLVTLLTILSLCVNFSFAQNPTVINTSTGLMLNPPGRKTGNVTIQVDPNSSFWSALSVSNSSIANMVTGSVVIPFQMDTRSNAFYGTWIFDTIQANVAEFKVTTNLWNLVTSNLSVNTISTTNIYSATNWSDVFIGSLLGTSTNADRLQGYTASAFAGTNDVTKTSLTNTIAGVYVETANAGWVDILSKTNSWNNKAETSITNGILSSANSYTDGATNAQGILIGNLFTSNSTMQGQVDGLFVSNSTVVSSLGGYLSTNGGTVSWLKVNGAQTNVGPVVMQSNLTVAGNVAFTSTSNVLGSGSVGDGNVVLRTNSSGGWWLGSSNFYIWSKRGVNLEALYMGVGSKTNAFEIRVDASFPNGVFSPQISFGTANSFSTTPGSIPIAQGLSVTIKPLTVSTTSYLNNATFSTTTGTSPSNVMTFALGDARYLSVTGTSNNMAWTSLPYNGSWQTNAMTLNGVGSTNVLMVGVVPDDPGATYGASYLAPNTVLVTRLATSTLNPITNSITVSSTTPLASSDGLNTLATNAATVAALAAPPFFGDTTNITLTTGQTGTVVNAWGRQPRVTLTGSATLTADLTTYATTGVTRVALELWTGTNTLTVLSTSITASFVIDTNAWNSILLRRTANGLFIGRQQ